MECNRFAARVRVLGAALVAGLVVLGLPAGVAGAAAGPGDLFTSSQAGTADAGIGSERPVSVNTGLLPADQPLSVRMNFTPEATFDARLVPADEVDGGWHHWRGHVAGDADSSVTLLRRDDAVAALVTTADGAYRVSYGGGQTQTVAVVDQSELPQGDLVRAVPSSVAAQVADPAPAADGAPVIDVLVAYTPAAETEQGGAAAIESEAALAVAVTNDSYTASGVDAQLRLVQTVRTNTGGHLSETLLNQLTAPNDGVMDELHAARDAAGADLVALLTESSSSCGIAWLMNQLSTNQATHGFSATAVDCAVDNMSFAHEIGHNLGATHDRYVASSNALFVDGYGYVDLTARTRTIMAYNNACADAGFNCTRLARWSNPGQTLDGRPLGIAAGQPDSADDHSALNTSAAVVAQYRAAAAPPPAPGTEVSVTAPTAALPGQSVAVSMVPVLPAGVVVSQQEWSTSAPQCRFANPGALQTTFSCPATLLGAQPTVTATVTDSTGAVTTDTATITLTTPATPRTTALRLAVAPRTVSPGGSVSIAGTLTDAVTRKPVIGLPVAVFQWRTGSAWAEVARAGTDSNGAVAFTARADRSTWYALASASNGAWARTDSAMLLVTVTPRVSQRLSAGVVRSGTTVSVTGTVTPAVRGEAVRLEVLSGRVWRPAGAALTTATGGYTLRVRPARGRWQYRVVKPADGFSGGATGAAMTVTVR